MASHIERRKFLATLGGAAVAWPLAARAQAGRVWRIGFVAGGARPVPLYSSAYAGFLHGMRELGYVEGKDYVVEWRFAEGRFELFPDFAAEFARLKVDVIVTALGIAVPPMQQANISTPIIMGYSIDPVGLGFITSLARPGGNTTGLSSAIEDIVAKQVDLLITAVPGLSRLAVLGNPANLTRPIVLKTVEAAARQAGLNLLPLEVPKLQDIERTFEVMTRERAGALIVQVDPFFFTQRALIAELALRHRLPSISGNREYVEAGGLMSYGDSLREFYRRAATFVDKIFKGAKPGDLPVERPTRFNLTINRKTANMLGLDIPPQLQMFADEVIE